MGNCLDLFSSEDPPPPYSSEDPPSSTGLTRSPPPSDAISRLLQSPFDGFTPVLPFRTPSDLAALYELGPELGRGQFGIIRKCEERASGTAFACKSISKQRMRSLHAINDVVREIDIMRRLSDHCLSHCDDASSKCNIVHLHEVVEDSVSVHLIMELCSGGELFDRIAKVKRYTEAQAAVLMKSLLQTLKSCHGIGIMHRDLKPENVLFVNDSDDSDIKLADFGLALEFVPGQKFSGIAGSTYYMAPEVLQGKYSEEIDVWSAGVIMYVLLCGMPPFWGHTDESIFEAIQHGQLDLTSGPWETVSQPAKDLIAQMLCVNVELRCTPSQALDHAWFMQQKVSEACRPMPSLVSDWSQNLEHNRIVEVSSNCSAITSVGTVTDKELEISKSLGTMTTSALVNMSAYGLQSSPSELHHSELGLNKLKVALAAFTDAQELSLSESLLKLRLKTGWTCILLTTNAIEESLMIHMGHHSYLIVHDKLMRRIKFRVLKVHGYCKKARRATPRKKLPPVFGHV